jgi:hypothetical protein
MISTRSNLIDHDWVQERLIEPLLHQPASARGPGLVQDGEQGRVGRGVVRGGEYIEAGHGSGGQPYEGEGSGQEKLKTELGGAGVKI